MNQSLYEKGYAFPLECKRRSGVTPWELYRRVHPKSPHSFFLDSLEYHPPAQRYSYLGWDPHSTFIYSGTRRDPHLFSQLRKWLGAVRVPRAMNSDFFTGGVVGFWSYELAEELESVSLRAKMGPTFPKLYLLFVRDLIVFDHREDSYRLISWVVPEKRVSFQRALGRAREKISEMEALLSHSNGQVDKEDFNLLRFRPEISKSDFERMVRQAKDYIAAGDIYQANLSQRFTFQFKGSPLMLYDRLRRTNPSPYAAAVQLGDLFIASSSPELLFAKKGRTCVTSPIAGTRPRGRSAGETRRLSRELLSNEKERAEHLMLVDLERNDLGRVSEWRSVRVKDFMRLEKYARVIHIVSEITSRLRPNQDAWDVIRAMFPGGTITGCPKIRSMEIIDELEPVQRGIYTGSLGYVGFDGNAMLNIAIRTLVLQKDRGFLQVGAGIVADSDPEREYDETLAKGEALAEALTQASVS